MCAPTPSFAQPAGKNQSSIGSDYVFALAAADHLLQDWQSGDLENGVASLTAHAKQSMSRDELDALFSNTQPKAYEIGRGKPLKPGRYEFPVVLTNEGGRGGLRRHFASIVVVNTGNNDWAVDKLPR